MLEPSVQHSFTLGIRKYLVIPLTVVATTVLTAAVLWPLEATPQRPRGSTSWYNLMAFVALAFPLARTRHLALLPVFIGASAFGAIIELIQSGFGCMTGRVSA
ncbi:hypothetical protein N9M02_01765 [Amylibacter sp.]|nr:hypothetical protein [Amylibacter sp.]